ncbi:MAG: hypothetical protein JNL67_01240 [Planctomycetaceae bacterium]|nr:hypothetical protein [Planctomycetaceae bacterium]
MIRLPRPRLVGNVIALLLSGCSFAVAAEISPAARSSAGDLGVGTQEKSILPESPKTPATSAAPEEQTRPLEAAKPQEKSEQSVDGNDDAQLFVNPKYDDSALPVRREEEWTPPPPIDWSIDGVLELSFDHLKFNIQADQAFEVRQLTLDLLKLRGRKIKIRGYIRPSFKEKDITRFVFVRDNQECCFGPGALLYDCMIVNMAPGHSIDFSTRPISLEGRFELKPFRGPDKRVWAIFELNDTELK